MNNQLIRGNLFLFSKPEPESKQFEKGERFFLNQAGTTESLFIVLRVTKENQLILARTFPNEKAADIRKTELLGVGRQLEASLKNLSVKYGAPLRVSFPDTSVMADETLLLSLLYNLADNAFKATENGGEVSVYGEDRGAAVRIAVKDSGRGIAQESLKMLTQPFFREDKSRSRKLGGAGLGLSICEAIAKLHGTALDFKSEPGKGTEVSFILKKAVETK